MKITNFDRTNLRMLRQAIDAALEDVGKDYGISIEAGNATFGENIATFKVECATIAKNGKVVSKAAEDFNRYAQMFGLEPSDLGREFTHRGRRYTITGLKPRSHTYPIVATRDDGKSFKFPVSAVKQDQD